MIKAGKFMIYNIQEKEYISISEYTIKSSDDLKSNV